MIFKHYKEAVDYSKGKPNAHCALCRHFRAATHRCELVRGVIMPSMWCKLYAPKKAKDAAA